VTKVETDNQKASCTYDQFPPQMNQPQIHQEFYTQVVEEPMPYPAYQMPMTPSEFGSDHDTSYCSPPPQLSQHMDQMYAQAANGAGSVERQHTTSGVRLVLHPKIEPFANSYIEKKSAKPSSSTGFSRTQREACPRSGSSISCTYRQIQQARIITRKAPKDHRVPHARK
jgi:hypothetical protein